MHAKELQRFKWLLVEKRQELQTLSASPGATIPRAGGLEGDEEEQANADAEAELHIQLHKPDGRLLRAIEDAFIRIGQGTYGTCEIYREPISKARLKAVPWTRHCRECKEREHPAT